jgi:uncharacterized LabA/DUF88 family protein
MTTESFTPGSKSRHHDPAEAEPGGQLFEEDLLRHMSPVVTAVMVDAGFFLKRARKIFGWLSPDEAAKRLHGIALDHLNDPKTGHRVARLYRVFVYDAPPAAWKGHTPISKKPVDLSKTKTAQWRSTFHESLRGMRKVALRLGEIPTSQVRWQLKPEVLTELLHGKRNWESLTDGDFRLDLRQKGVDMRLGIDIASVAFQRQVNQIVLVSGDADFVPAAKMARRQGIDIVLDPMGAPIRPKLYEHIDGLRSVCTRRRGLNRS